MQESRGTCTYDEVVTTGPHARASLQVALLGWAQGRDATSVTPVGSDGLRLVACRP